MPKLKEYIPVCYSQFASFWLYLNAALKYSILKYRHTSLESLYIGLHLACISQLPRTSQLVSFHIFVCVFI
jgi:hypothetical protein